MVSLELEMDRPQLASPICALPRELLDIIASHVPTRHHSSESTPDNDSYITDSRDVLAFASASRWTREVGIPYAYREVAVTCARGLERLAKVDGDILEHVR